MVTRSSDGASWDELGGKSAASLEEASVATFVSFQGGIVAAGSDHLLGTGAIWVSDDGSFWHRVPFEPDAGTSIEYLAALGDRLLAVGSDSRRRRGGRGTVVMWESEDAVSWKQVAVSELFSNAVANSIASSDESILVFGTLFEDRDGAQLETIPVSWEWTPTQPPE